MWLVETETLTAISTTPTEAIEAVRREAGWARITRLSPVLLPSGGVETGGTAESGRLGRAAHPGDDR